MRHTALRYYYYSGSRYSAELTAWLAAGTAAGYTLPSSTVQDALDALLKTPLATGTVASRMKTGYILHAGSKNMAKLNIKDPATYPLTESGTVTFSEGNGCKSASNSYFNQPFKSDEYAGIESDLTWAGYVSESSTDGAGAPATQGFKTDSAASRFFLVQPMATANTAGYRHYGVGPSSPASNTNHKGLYIYTHTGTNHVFYKDGVKTSEAYTPTAPNISINRLILAYNGASTSNTVSAAAYYPRYLSFDFLFDRFTDTDAANFRTAFETYKTAVSLP